MYENLLVYLLMNIGLQVLIASVLVEVHPVQHILLRKKNKYLNQLVLGVIFGLFSIYSTYIGYEIQGAILNTRVVSTVAAGLIGGPLSGVCAGVLSGLHRYFYHPGGFTTLACATGTVLFGIIGALFQKWYLRQRKKNLSLVLLVLLSELAQAVIILAIARPFSAAWSLERTILLPKALVNSLGLVLFINVFQRLNHLRSVELAEQHYLALLIAQECLPYLRYGTANRPYVQRAVEIVHTMLDGCHVALTDRDAVLAQAGMNLREDCLPPASQQAIAGNQLTVVRPDPANGHDAPLLDHVTIAAPLLADTEVVGSLLFVVPQAPNLVLDGILRTIEGLSHFFSTMLELGALQHQFFLRQQAEFRALQAQITPHFLFNALNTISALCLTSPDRAREQILTLSDYFRQILLINEPLVTLEQEISHATNYLSLIRVRFEDSVHITWDLPENLQALCLPPLVLQPIVENAVRHGASANRQRYVHISISQTSTHTQVSVIDRGAGFSQEVLAQLNNPNESRYSGLFNVRKRLHYIYGEQCLFQVQSTPQGSTVSFSIPTHVPERLFGKLNAGG